MLTFNLKDMKGGWIIGDFQPAIMMTKCTEVAIKRYKAEDREPAHIHKIADEITVVVEGTVSMNGKVFEKDTIIWLSKGEAAEFVALTDAVTCVIKTPSVPGDKHLI